MNDPRATAPWWTADHEVLLERARRLEEARTLNNATASARAILHEGKRGRVETEHDFAAAKQRAAAAGTPIDPRFQTWVEWERTASAARQALRAMYPPETEQTAAALGRGDPTAVEWPLVFLEADPRCFRAGYLRETILRRPTPWDLSREMRLMGASRDEASFLAEFEARLADIRRRTLPVAQRREFKSYCRLASHLAGDDLKNELEARARADDSVVARRARLVLGAIVRKQKPTPQD
ncbi:MAG TPA: hypothetical protein VIJ58_11175 [Candidatus Dormibacteraeota bacterium]